MDDKYLATYPCYVMYIPELTYVPSTHALHASPALRFFVTLDDQGHSLFAFSSIDDCAKFIADFPDCPLCAILPVADAEMLAKIVLSIKAREGIGPCVRFDASKAFPGHWISYESVASGGTDEIPSLEE